METHDQQRRIMLQRTFLGACALVIPVLLGGCNRTGNQGTGKGGSGESSGESSSGYESGGSESGTGMKQGGESKEGMK